MKKLCVFCMALLMLVMTACGKGTSGGGQSVDLRAAYEAAIAQVNEELGDNAPALLEETAVELLNGYYPGIADIQLKQSVFFLSPTATSCEVAMVEVADSADAAKVRDIFQTRVDTMANDTVYPDEAAMWKTAPQCPSTGATWCWRCCRRAAPFPTHFWPDFDGTLHFPALCGIKKCLAVRDFVPA